MVVDAYDIIQEFCEPQGFEAVVVTSTDRYSILQIDATVEELNYYRATLHSDNEIVVGYVSSSGKFVPFNKLESELDCVEVKSLASFADVILKLSIELKENATNPTVICAIADKLELLSEYAFAELSRNSFFVDDEGVVKYERTLNMVYSLCDEDNWEPAYLIYHDV